MKVFRVRLGSLYLTKAEGSSVTWGSKEQARQFASDWEAACVAKYRHAKVEEEEITEVAKPVVKGSFDLAPLIELCKAYIDNLGTDRERDDTRGYIFEAAMELVYGKNVWAYVRSKLR